MKEATNASGLVDAASISLYRAVASKNEVDALDAQISAANKLADPQEKKAKLEEINRSTLAKTANMKFNEIAEAVKKEHNDKKSAAINASLYNLGLGGLQDADLVSTGKKLVWERQAQRLQARFLRSSKQSKSSLPRETAFPRFLETPRL